MEANFCVLNCCWGPTAPLDILCKSIETEGNTVENAAGLELIAWRCASSQMTKKASLIFRDKSNENTIGKRRIGQNFITWRHYLDLDDGGPLRKEEEAVIMVRWSLFFHVSDYRVLPRWLSNNVGNHNFLFNPVAWFWQFATKILTFMVVRTRRKQIREFS